MIVLTTLCALALSPQSAKDQPQVHNATGVRSVTFERKEGAVNVYLPNDIRPGDTISGTVISAPAGKNDQEIQRNAAVLNGMVVSVGAEAQKGPGKLSFAVPASGVLLPLILKDASGKARGTYTPPIFAAWPAVPHGTTLGPTDFSIPPIAQAGGFTPIAGAFDGKASNTSVTLGGEDCPVIAESPRAACVFVPRSSVGTQNLELKEQGFSTFAPVQCLKLTLSAPKTNLMKGERTTVSVQVSGLEGLPPTEYPIPFQFTNLTPSNIKMGNGSNIHRVLISAAAVTGGSWSTGVAILASIDGPFQVEGTVYCDFNDDRKANLPAKAINAWIKHLIEDFEKEIKEKKNDPAKATRVALLEKVVANLKTVKVTDNNALERGNTLRAVDVQLNLISALDVGCALVEVAADMLGYTELPFQNILDILVALKNAGTVSDSEALDAAIGATAVGSTIQDAKKKLEQAKKVMDALKRLQDSLKKQIGN